jgi:hypothetical protein
VVGAGSRAGAAFRFRTVLPSKRLEEAMDDRLSALARRMQGVARAGLGVATLALCCLPTSGWAQRTAVAAVDDRQNFDRLLVVDCLLPGQVRQLGTGVTYLGATARHQDHGCRVRDPGGEYVAYDRSNYATALKVWMGAAQGGDKRRRPYVGEIYEKAWASARLRGCRQLVQEGGGPGYPRALINLGFLYEQGLGVPKDPVAALQLYRKAGGLEGSINLDGAAPGGVPRGARLAAPRARAHAAGAREGAARARRRAPEIEPGNRAVADQEDAGGRRR